MNANTTDRTSSTIHIVMIKGSMRPGNYTSMAANLVLDELKKRQNVSTDVIDPVTLNLPPPGTDPQSTGGRYLREQVGQATGVVLATPEYHGSFSSVMKLIIENLGFPSALAGKPVALLGVAGGTIGAVKSLEHLRSVVSHVGGIVLPLPISVANVQTVFDSKGQCLDEPAEQLIRSVATNLLAYIEHNVCPRVTLERLLSEEDRSSPKIVSV
ncbi:MAG: NAD(P)H-dependent oxidoreductase [Nitrospira sp.]|nr:NAD(P)H-dependent oxidoreductase [Nitrospira sp.]